MSGARKLGSGNNEMSREDEYEILTLVKKIMSSEAEKTGNAAGTALVKYMIKFYTKNGDRRNELMHFLDTKFKNSKSVFKDWKPFIKFWMMATYNMFFEYDKQITGNQVIDVRGDGSCFYQCLIYALMGCAHDVDTVPDTVLKLKKTIIKKLYGVDVDTKKQLEESEHIQPLPAYRDQIVIANEAEHSDANKRPPPNALSIAKKMGLSAKGNEVVSDNGVWGNTFVADLAALAFGVQIIQYQISKLEMSQMMNDEDKKNVKAGLQYITMDFAPHGLFEHVPVIVLLNQYQYHYCIVSRFPLLKMVWPNGTKENGIDRDGMGVEGVQIPPFIELKWWNQGAVCAKMPSIQRCMSCNKIILSD